MYIEIFLLSIIAMLLFLILQIKNKKREVVYGDLGTFIGNESPYTESLVQIKRADKQDDLSEFMNHSKPERIGI